MAVPFTDSSKFNIMISYSHQDSELMIRIRDLLTANGFDVWVDTKLKGGSNFFKNIGSAVIGCDIFLFILTEHSVASKFCQDEVSLARISNKKILPVTYCAVTDVIPEMDAGLRLILSCVQWICLDPKLDDEENDRQIFMSLNETLQTDLSDDSRLANYHIEFSEEESTASVKSHSRVLRRVKSIHLAGFWARNFGEGETKADLKDVLAAIKQDYSFDFMRLKFDDTWASKALTFWCFDLERSATFITRAQYDKFIFPEGRAEGQREEPDTFWVRCKDGFSVRLSMQEVFNAQSSVRYDSIQNLSKIKNKRVITALCKLLRDNDPNIRAVACISLSYTGNSNPSTIDKVEKLLKDDDRLVRESACVALGKFQCAESVPALLNAWRNDMISDVRAAALRALQIIDTPEAAEGMKVVKTLQEEINKLGVVEQDSSSS